MNLFAFDVEFGSGRSQTLFFRDFRLADAVLRAPDVAREMYGARADDIVSITLSARFNGR
jgi:hypothetical protein